MRFKTHRSGQRAATLYEFEVDDVDFQYPETFAFVRALQDLWLSYEVNKATDDSGRLERGPEHG